MTFSAREVFLLALVDAASRASRGHKVRAYAGHPTTTSERKVDNARMISIQSAEGLSEYFLRISSAEIWANSVTDSAAMANKKPKNLDFHAAETREVEITFCMSLILLQVAARSTFIYQPGSGKSAEWYSRRAPTSTLAVLKYIYA